MLLQNRYKVDGMIKKRYTGISFVAGIVLLVALSMGASAAKLSAITSDSIKEKQEQISQVEKEKKELESGLSDLQKIKKELEKQKADLKKYVEQLDGNLAQIEQNIAELKAKIAVKEEEIKVTEAELLSAMETEQNQKESMITRIRLMYEQGDTYMMEMFLKAESFGEFLNQADYMERVIAYDRDMWDKYKENRQYVELCKEELELEKQVLDQAKANVEAEQNSLELLIAQKTQDIISYETDINTKQQAIREYEAEILQQEEEIKALEDAITEEKKQILINSGVVLSYDGGEFKFPLASYTRVSDDYGDRIHPTLHVPQFHNGVDFAAPKGTAIYAAYDGRVVAAAYSSTMGKYVMIDHGDGLYTIYMHASALYVEGGDIVIRGETIAAVGSTGRSTGNHLHFSVRKNGTYQSPWNYLKK